MFKEAFTTVGFHVVFQMAFNVIGPSSCALPHVGLPSPSLFNTPILVSPSSLHNSGFYFSFLGGIFSDSMVPYRGSFGVIYVVAYISKTNTCI